MLTCSSGVSSTVPTVEFTKNEIIRSDDAFSDSPDVRRLDIKRSNEKKKGIRPRLKPKGAVMNDVSRELIVYALTKVKFRAAPGSRSKLRRQ